MSRVIATVSGKGGTGKTTVSVAMARALAERYKVGLFDIDISGANSHRLLNIVKSYDVVKGEDDMRIIPAVAEVDGRQIQFMSIALVSESYLGWKPGEYSDFVEQLFNSVKWDVDFLILDAPPGTHEELITALKYVDVAVLVVIPAQLAHLDARRTLELLSDLEVPVAGQYINFAHAVCPQCGTKIQLFDNIDGIEGIPIIERIPFVRGLPNLDVNKLLTAVNNPIKVDMKRPSKVKRALLKMLLRRFGK